MKDVNSGRAIHFICKDSIGSATGVGLQDKGDYLFTLSLQFGFVNIESSKSEEHEMFWPLFFRDLS